MTAHDHCGRELPRAGRSAAGPGAAEPQGLHLRPGGALVPGLRRLRGAGGVPGLHARAGHPQGEHRHHLRHRLLLALPLLRRLVRDALDPRARAGHRDRRGHGPAGHRGVRDHRRRGRAVDRRQPPDPRAAAQRQPDHPAVQQPDLRADQGPVLPHLRDRQGHQVHPDGLAGQPVQPGVAGPGRRGDLRRPDHRLRPQAPDQRAEGRRRPPGHLVRGDLPELPDLQRRRLRRDEGAADLGRRDHPAAARRSRSASAPTGTSGWSATRRPASSRWSR